MGIRTIVIAATIGTPMMAMLAGTAHAQIVPPSGKAGLPTSAQAGASTTSPPEAPSLAKDTRDRIDNSSVRAPVRREVPPKPRRVVKSATPPEPAVATSAAATSTTPPPAAQQPRTSPPRNIGTAIPLATAAAGKAAEPAQPALAAPSATAVAWSEAEIQQAKSYCEVLLRGVDASYVPDDPIRQGECGSPVIFKVSSVGKGPAIELSPPVLLTCDMIAALDKWSKRELQPQARALLGSSIVRIETMSSYSCRNAYGRTKSRLSEHGRANAIDISGFSTSKDTTTVLASWGSTARELKALAAKQEAERAAAALAQSKSQTAPPLAAAGPPQGLPGTIAPLPGSGRVAPSTFGLAPTRLGGPKAAADKSAAAATAPNPAADDAKRRFLREVHSAACKHFGTVLGPEANNAHKNHFHLDMAPRKLNNFCE